MSNRVAIVSKYMEHRQAQRNDEVLKLVADNVKLISARDGTFDGKAAFLEYLSKTEPTGTWEDPHDDGATISVPGKVKVALINWSIRATFTFNSNDLIEKIEIKKD